MTSAELLVIVGQNDLLGSEPSTFETRALQIKPKICAAPEAVRQALQEFHPEQGWLCFQSALKRFLKGEPVPDAGVILYGEVKGRNGSSLHIQQNGEGGWILTYYDEQRDGDAFLAENVVLIAENHPDDPMNVRYDVKYRIYWGGSGYGQQDDDGHGWRQVAAAFAGFERVEKMGQAGVAL